MPALCANALRPTYGWSGSGATLQISSIRCAVSVSRASRSAGTHSIPSLSCRAGRIENRFAFPHRSPYPFTVPCTSVAPTSTAASEFATAHSASLCVWMPTATRSPRASTTPAVASPTSWGRLAPFVSHRVTFSAPASPAALTHSSAYAGSSRHASKKCSASYTTRLPPAARKAIESPIIARFSSRETRVTFSRWSAQVLPTRVQIGAKHEASTCRPGSSAALTRLRRVIPNAQICACSSSSPARVLNSSSSLGFEAGNPASIRCTPSRSSACTTRTFSAADSDMP
jgi:hypothetical protein